MKEDKRAGGASACRTTTDQKWLIRSIRKGGCSIVTDEGT